MDLPRASKLWLDVKVSFAASILSVAACTLVWAVLSLRYTCMLLGQKANKQPTNKSCLLAFRLKYVSCVWLLIKTAQFAGNFSRHLSKQNNDKFPSCFLLKRIRPHWYCLLTLCASTHVHLCVCVCVCVCLCMRMHAHVRCRCTDVVVCHYDTNVSKEIGMICLDNCMCCHTETELAAKTISPSHSVILTPGQQS